MPLLLDLVVEPHGTTKDVVITRTISALLPLLLDLVDLAVEPNKTVLEAYVINHGHFRSWVKFSCPYSWTWRIWWWSHTQMPKRQL